MEVRTGVLLTLYLTICLFEVSLSLHCLKCDRVISPRHCHGRTTCDSHEVCYLEQFTGDDGETLYNVGCKSRELCTSVTTRAGSTKVGQNICSKCCTGNLCNVEGCGAIGYPNDRGPICFNCAQTRNPERCDQIEVCGRDDICHIEEKEEFGDIFYTTNCLSKHLCNTKTGTIFGKRTVNQKRVTTTICTACCSGDLCNSNCYKNSVTRYTLPFTKPYSIDYTTVPWNTHTTKQWNYPSSTRYYQTTSDWHSYFTTNGEFVAGEGHYGNNFVITYMPNANMLAANKTIELLITSPYADFNVEITSKVGFFKRTGQSYKHAMRTTLPVDIFQNYGQGVHNGNKFPTGIQITSRKPIFVAAVSDYNSLSGEGYSAIPIRNIGSKYVVAAYPSGTKMVGVVATQDNTYVRAGLQAGKNSTTTVHIKYAGETAFFSSDDTIITTGGVISADAPISVFSGNMETYIKVGTPNYEIEMNIPVEKYSMQYIVPKIYGAKTIILRVIPSPDDHFATVYITGKDGFYQSIYKEFVNELSLKNFGYFINAQRNVMVSLYTKYESTGNESHAPFMTLLPAINQYSNNYVVTTPSTLKFNSYITVIFKQSDDENGLRINGGNLLFHAVDRTPISKFREQYLSISVPLDMNESAYTITHTDPNVKFGVLVYGYGKTSSTSYAYPGGFNFDNH